MPGKPPCEAAIDARFLKLRDDLPGRRILAEARRQHGLPAEPCYGEGRVRRRASADDGEIARTVFLRLARHLLDRVDRVERGDADTENLAHRSFATHCLAQGCPRHAPVFCPAGKGV